MASSLNRPTGTPSPGMTLTGSRSTSSLRIRCVRGQFRDIAVDPGFIPKAGNKTPWFGKFWSGVGPDGVQAKVKALGMCRGVMRPYPHPRSAEYITGLAAVRGSQWGVMCAEAFEVVLRKYE